MGVNKILPFAKDVGADVLDDATYDALAARGTGYQTGTAIKEQLNKTWRQAAFVASAVAQFVVDADDGDVTDDDEVQDFADRILAAIQAAAIGAGSSTGESWATGIDCRNNAGTPDTLYDLKADSIVVRGPGNITKAIHNSGAAISCDIESADGPIINGRDQAADFDVSSWVYFYWIWDGATLATLCSEVPPPVGPTLPAGYTHWAFAAAVYIDGDGDMIKTRTRGSRGYYEARQNVLNAAENPAETAINIDTRVPPNALAFLISAELPSTGTATTATLRYISGSDYIKLSTSGGGSASLTAEVPNVDRDLFYLMNVDDQDQMSVWVLGFVIPNGGE